MPIAPYFANVPADDIRVLPPWEPKDRGVIQWVRGRIQGADGKDLVVTCPSLRVCFPGCKYNKLVLALDGPEAKGFRDWLLDLAHSFDRQVFAEPERFKPGAKTALRFIFDHDLIKPSSQPALYPDQITMRLSTERGETINADLFEVCDDEIVKVDPAEVKGGSRAAAVSKVGYFRNGERFGLTLTVLRARFFPYVDGVPKISNEEWELEIPMDMGA